jgi:hypothetical protein
MTYLQIAKNLPDESIQLLTELVSEGLINEDEIVVVLKRTFKITSTQDDFLICEAVNKLIFVLQFLSLICKGAGSLDTAKETITRLKSKNGIGAVNEFFCHSALLTCFPTYRTSFPLFAKGVDGVIEEAGTGEVLVGVEIKSRFAKIYELLENFVSQLATTLPARLGLAISYKLEIIEINSIDANICKQEINYICKECEFISLIELQDTPIIRLLSQSTVDIVYKLEITIRQMPPRISSFNVPSEFQDKYFFGHFTAKPVNNILQNFKEFTVVLSDVVKDKIAKAIILGCFSNIENMPEGLRVIAIHTSGIRSNDKFISNVIDGYINSHPDIMLIIFNAAFGSNIQVRGMTMPYVKIGRNLEELMTKYFIKPNLTTQIHQHFKKS